MRGGDTAAALRHVRHLIGSGTTTGLTDEALLGRFLDNRDAIAFEALVARHGPMVLGVCRSIVRDESAAEDAFQAVFLVLVRRARSVRVDGSLGRWLHGVSLRVATRASREVVRRRARERPAIEPFALDPDEAERHERAAILRDEVGRLPASCRAVVLACGFEGLSHEEAAARLRWPIGTVKGRMSRAKRLLRERLARRGVGLAAAPIGAALAAEARAAVVRSSLRETTSRMAVASLLNDAIPSAGAVPASVALANGVLKAMTWTKMAAAAATVAMATLAVGTGIRASVDADQEPGSPTVARPSASGSDLGERLDREEQNYQDAIKDRRTTLERIMEERQRATQQRLRMQALEDEADRQMHRVKEDLEKVERDYHLFLRKRSEQALEPAGRAVRPDDPGRRADAVVEPLIVAIAYPVGDLVTPAGADEKPDFTPLIELLKSSVAPGSWKDGVDPNFSGEPDADGRPRPPTPSGADERGRIGSISSNNVRVALIICHRGDVHAQVVERLRQVRRLRGLREDGTADERPAAKEADSPKGGPGIEPGDVVELKLVRDPAGTRLSGEYLVGPDGTLWLWPYGKVAIAGMDLAHAREKVAEHLREDLSDKILGMVDGRLPATGGLEVRVRKGGDEVFYVLGAVHKPGRFDLKGATTVLDALQLAGGLEPDGDVASIRLVRTGGPAGDGRLSHRTLPVDVEAIMQRGVTTTNYRLRTGDRLYVAKEGEKPPGGTPTQVPTTPAPEETGAASKP